MSLCATYGPHNYIGERKGMLIELWQAGPDSFSVLYGLQKKSGLTYGEAATEFGACVMHYEACNGSLDNRTRAEAQRDAAIRKSCG